MISPELHPHCQWVSCREKFGLCDDPSPAETPAYIDETDAGKWIATLVNPGQKQITFTAIDHCIEVRDPNGDMESRCDGMLTYDSTIIFVELKKSSAKKNNHWIKEGEKQLKTSIATFQPWWEGRAFSARKAYLSNGNKPEFRSSQAVRMEKFKDDTGFVLRIEATIEIE